MSKTKFKIKRDDTVKVVAGKDRGKVGRVEGVIVLAVFAGYMTTLF